ncbi:aldo/keto reductase [Gracilibacillus alcaliphilus]|uniref:aldo/keto reductase n=1 Tax=Gracilibacillus alcaliphilus TaxID=1401441 RepID=UPI00195ECCE7|nr:aldo/keto reductase [Gracilibacillus alcaliphilus]MBM7676319.1 diketogulonate reductase-like aldo/keto reductase [Gracilibacillus alcaliphilus]
MEQTIPSFTLHDGIEIPAIGFGTASIKGAAGARVIASALNHGYRLIDTAYNYENEGAVGAAIRQSGIPRNQVFVTSKLPGRYHDYAEAIQALQESLFRANLDYFDLYLIHWPNPKQGKYLEAWQALIDAQKWGLVRSIGVSNFLPEHLEHLQKETGVLPTVNQIELHPFFNQKQQCKWHEEHHIITESWSPLYRAKDIIENESLQQIADKYKKSVGQIILRWHYQLGAVSIPRSTSSIRQLNNISIFDFALDYEDMEKINSLSKADGRIGGQDPSEYEEF